MVNPQPGSLPHGVGSVMSVTLCHWPFLRCSNVMEKQGITGVSCFHHLRLLVHHLIRLRSWRQPPLLFLDDPQKHLTVKRTMGSVT